MLRDGRKFLLGAEPSLADCALYNPVWFIQSQLGAARPRRSTGCPRSSPGRERMKALGSGKRSRHQGDRGARHRQGGRAGDRQVDANDPSGLKAGQKISVTPDDTGKVPVDGHRWSA